MFDDNLLYYAVITDDQRIIFYLWCTLISVVVELLTTNNAVIGLLTCKNNILILYSIIKNISFRIYFLRLFATHMF